MDWAKDQLGKHVHASQHGLFSYVFYCGACGARVFRRAGPQRRPHFAHYGHSGKPDCEYYHPSLGAVVPGTGRAGGDDRVRPCTPSLRGGLFLERKISGGYSLYIKLPRLAGGTSREGTIEIRSGLGVRSYSALQLQRPRFMPVIPQLPLVEVVGQGELTDVTAAIRDDVSRFSSSGNYFRVSETGGKLLAPDEPLEWGGRYQLLTRRALAPAPAVPGMEIVAEDERQKWYFYELKLPTLSQADSYATRESIALYLSRSVRAPNARVYFIDPPAHHIELDSTHVFPEPTERILLRRTEACRLRIEGNVEVIGAASMRDLDDDTCEIVGVGSGDFTVLVNDREQLLGRIGKCELFNPEGVRVTVGDRSWELFERDLLDALQLHSQENLRIECPSGSIAEQLTLDDDRWILEGSTLTPKVSVRNLNVNAWNFGSVIWYGTEEQRTDPRVSSAQILARRVWIEGVVMRRGGPVAFSPIRGQWSGEIGLGLSDTTLGDLAWLRPHINLARIE